MTLSNTNYTKKEFTFRDQEHIYTDTIRLEKIVFKLLRYLHDLPTKVELKEAALMEIHFDTPGGEIDIFHKKSSGEQVIILIWLLGIFIPTFAS